MGDLDLARRAMKATGWVWSRPERVTALRGGRVVHREVESGVLWGLAGDEWLLDVGDDATIGRLDALMRERWGAGFEVMPYVTHVRGPDGNLDVLAIWWRLEAIGIDMWGNLTHAPVSHPGDVCRRIAGPTRVAALVAALEVPRG